MGAMVSTNTYLAAGEQRAAVFSGGRIVGPYGLSEYDERRDTYCQFSGFLIAAFEK
jgi:hypothetical protein